MTDITIKATRAGTRNKRTFDVTDTGAVNISNSVDIDFYVPAADLVASMMRQSNKRS